MIIQSNKNRTSNYRKIKMTTLTFLVAVYVGLVLNLPIYLKINEIFSTMSVVKMGFAISIPIFFIAAFNLIFNLFSWHYIAKPFFLIIIISSSLASYATLKYGVVFDYSMIENTFQTNSSEVASYINFSSIRWFILTGVLPALLVVWLRIDYANGFIRFALRKALTIIISLTVMAMICLLYYKDYASVGRNHSYLKKMIVTAHIFNTVRYLDETYVSPPTAFITMGTDAKVLPSANGKPTLMVLVVGETARSMDYQLNGYGKATNPFTSRYDVVSFKDVSSCGTATAYSLPCMFSNFNRSNYDRRQARNQDSLLDVINYAGISTLWVDNDGGSKGVADRISFLPTDASADDENCDGDTCYDAVLLENLDSEISQMKADNKIIALHIIGSHGPTYWKRYPPEMEVFTPACDRSDIENCTNEEVVNTYDNSIRYTDYVIGKLIAKLQSYKNDYNTALVYISDHGESLGEDGLFLHGTPYRLAPKEQTKVPLIMWLSDSFVASRGINTQCLKRNASSKTYSQDNLFHSMLDLMNVATGLYNRKLDIISDCKV